LRPKDFAGAPVVHRSAHKQIPRLRIAIEKATWYILPVREVLERQTLLFRSKGYPRMDPYAYYREAWHLLRDPDGLTFG
jgi:hypothetical protein